MSEEGFPFAKRNYILMGISFLLIVLGFVLMISGSTDEQHFEESIFNAQHIVVAPTVALVGFFLMMYAILYKKGK